MRRDRAWRRFQSHRIEIIAYKKYKINYYYSQTTVSEANKESREKAAFLKNNLKNCSCFMCGNPRYHWKQVTIQELKALDNFKSQEY